MNPLMISPSGSDEKLSRPSNANYERLRSFQDSFNGGSNVGASRVLDTKRRKLIIPAIAFGIMLSVVTAICVSYFAGYSDGTKVMDDAAMTQALHSRVSTSVSQSMSIALSKDVVHDVPADDPKGGQGEYIAKLLEGSSGSSTLKLSSIELISDSATNVRLTGVGKLGHLNTSMGIDMGYTDGALQFNVHAFSTDANLTLGEYTKGTSQLRFQQTPALVIGQTVQVHSFNDKSSVTVQPGLNLIGSIVVSECPALAPFMAHVTQTGVSRRLQAPAQPGVTTLNTVAQMYPLGATQLFSLPDPFHLAPGILLSSVNVSVLSPASTYHISGSMSIALPGQSLPMSLSVEGVLSATGFNLTGSVANVSIGSSGVLLADEISVNLAGVIDNMAVTSVKGAAAIVLTVQQSTGLMVHMPLPLTSNSTLVWGLTNVHFGSNVVLQDAQLTFSAAASDILLKGQLVVWAGAALDPVNISVTSTLSPTGFSFKGSLSSWTLAVGSTPLTVTGLSVWFSSPQHACVDEPMSGGVKGSVTLASATFSLLMDLPATTAKPLLIDLSMTSSKALTLGDMASALCGASTVSGTPLPSGMRSSLLQTAVTNAAVQVTAVDSRHPLQLTMSGGVSWAGQSVTAQLVVRKSPNASSWDFGVGVALSTPKVSAITGSGDTSFDHLPFTTGYVVAASSSTPFQFTVPSSDTQCAGPGAVDSNTLQVTVSKGVSMQMLLPASNLLPYLSSSSYSGCLYVQGSFGSSSVGLSLTASLPPQLPIGGSPPVAEINGTVSIKGSSYSLSAGASILHGVSDAPLSMLITGSLTTGASQLGFSLSGTAKDWVLAGSLPGSSSGPLRVPDVTLQVTGSRSNVAGQQMGPLVVSGQLSGDVTFGADSLKAEVDFPRANSSQKVTVTVPSLRLSPNVRLHDISCTVAHSPAAGDTFQLQGTAGVHLADNMLQLTATATVAPGAYSFSATLPQWNVTGLSTVVARNLQLSLTGGAKAAGQPIAWSGALSGDLDFYGAQASLSVAFPAPTDAVLVTVSNLALGHNVKVTTASLKLQRVAPWVSLQAAGEVVTGVGSAAIPVTFSSTLSNTTFTLTGSVSSWIISSSLTASAVSMSFTGVRQPAAVAGAAASLKLSGMLTADLVVAGVPVTTEVLFPTPLTPSGGVLTLEVPNLRLSHDTVLHNVSLTASTAGAFTIGASASIDTNMQQPLLVDVSGSIAQSNLQVTGTLQHWQMEVGHFNLSVSALQLTISRSGGKTSGHFSGSVALGAFSLNLAALLPAPAGSTVDMNLTLAQTSPITVGQLANALCAGSLINTLKVPAALKNKVLGAQITAPTLSIRTYPNVTFVATGKLLPAAASMQEGLLGGMLGSGLSGAATEFKVFKNSTSGRWELIVGLYLPLGLKFSDLIPSITTFDSYSFPEVAFLISSVDTPFTFSPAVLVAPHLPPLVVVDGVAFFSTLPLSSVQKNGQLRQLSLWGNVSTLDISCTFGLDTHALTLRGALPRNVPLGKHVTINGSVVLSTVAPLLELQVDAAVAIHAHDQPAFVSGTIDLGTTDSFTLKAVGPSFHFHVGHQGLLMHNLSLDLSFTAVGAAEAVTGQLNGDITMGNETFGALLELPQPSGQGMELVLSAQDSRTVSMVDTISATCGMDAFKNVVIPASFSELTSMELFDARLTITTEPMSFTAQGSAYVLRLNMAVKVNLQVSQVVTGQWRFAIGVGMSQAFKFSDLAPSITDLGTLAPFTNGALVLSTFQQPYTFLTPAGWALTVPSTGVAFKGLLACTGRLQVIQKWTKISDLFLSASFGFSTTEFRLEAGINSDWKLGKRVAITGSSLFLDMGGPHGLAVGVSVTVTAMLGPRAQDAVPFVGSVSIGEVDVQVDGQMQKDWVDPLGIKGLTIFNTELAAGFTYAAGVPDMLGVSGGLGIDGVNGSATVYSSALTGSTVLAGSLSSFNLYSIVHTLSCGVVSGSLAKTILAVSFRDLSLAINTGALPVVFNQKTYQPGVQFKVAYFQLWAFTGSATVLASHTSGVYVDVSVNPVSMLKGAITLSGVTSVTSPARMSIVIGHNPMANKVGVEGFLHILGLGLAARLNVTDKNFDMYAAFVSELFNTTFSLHLAGGTPASPADFSLYAGLQNKLLDYLASHVGQFVIQTHDQINSHIKKAEDDVKSWHALNDKTLAAKQAEIAKISAADTAKFNAAEKKVVDARSKVVSAQSKVDNLQNNIHSAEASKRHCKWYDVGCHAHNTYEDTKIAGLWVAKHAADAALDVAKGVLTAAEKVVKDSGHVLPEADPRVIALHAEILVLTGARDALLLALKAAEKIADGAVSLVGKTVQEMATCFNVRSASFSTSSVMGMQTTGSVSLKLSGEFFKKNVDLSLSLQWPPKLSSVLSSVWGEVKKKL